jgi:putative PEP-CTERM system TPR-repeat lipoprotein
MRYDPLNCMASDSQHTSQIMNSRFLFSNGCKAIAATILVAVLSMGAGCEKLRNPTDVEYVQHAKAFQNKGDGAAAVVELKNALQKNPNNSEARWILGDIYVDQGLGREAEKELRRASELGIRGDAIKVSLGRALLLQNDFSKALAQSEPSANASRSAVVNLLVIRGEANLGLRHLDDACRLFSEALEQDARLVRAYWGLARCAFARGKQDESLALLKQAITLNDKNSDSWAYLGDFNRLATHLTDSETAYTTALKYRTQNVNAIVGRAATRAMAGKLDEATTDLDAAAKLVSTQPVITHLRGVVKFRKGRYPEAKADFESALKLAPDYSPTLLWLGLTHYALQEYEQASKYLTQYNRINPGVSQVEALMAMVQARMGAKGAATETLKRLDAINPADAQTLAFMGRTYMLIGDPSGAVQTFSKALDKDPAEAQNRIDLAVALVQKGDLKGAIQQLDKALEIKPDVERAQDMLIAALIEDRQYERAATTIDAVQAKRPKSPVPYNFRAWLMAAQSRTAEAEAEYRKALDLEPGNLAAGQQLAGSAMSRGDLDAARKLYRQILAAHKDDLPTLMALYALELKAKRPQEAQKVLEGAVAAHPEAPTPAAILAFSYMQAGNARRALQVSEAAAAASPDDNFLLTQRGSAYLALNDMGNARASFQRLVALKPEDPEAHFKLASASAASHDLVATRKELARALELNPKYLPAKIELARLSLAEKKPTEALNLAADARKLAPDNIEVDLVEAAAYQAQKQPPRAIALLEQSVTAHPESDRVLLALAKARWDAGESEAAAKLAQSWLQRHPDSVPALSFLAEANMGLGRPALAIANYEALLKQRPDDLSALNNLAVLLKQSQPEQALSYAERAYKLAPTQAAIADLWGWLLIESGKTDQGLDVLRKGMDAPNAGKLPSLSYHYAAALAKVGEKEQARRQLTRLLNSGAHFPEESKAKALLKQL